MEWNKSEEEEESVRDNGYWIMDNGSWIMDHGSWIMDKNKSKKRGWCQTFGKVGMRFCLFVCCVFLFLIGEVRYVSFLNP